ncbi:MAG: hypothetical protein KAX20_05630, partial [Candidatus Omnitrophica bacterium]|nr:hypothetical protein [Candidatus Omnitrophota bacterium]
PPLRGRNEVKGRENSASHLQKKLLKKGILIRDCSNIRGLNNSFIRVAVKSREENQKLLQAFRKILWKRI